MAKNKTVETNASVFDFIHAIDSKKKQEDAYLILEMMQNISGLEPRMWGPSIIGFGQYEHTYDSGHSYEGAFLAFSPRKAKHVLYVLSDWEGQQDLLDQLGKYKTGKVCLYINKLADVDLEILRQIIQASYDDTMKKFGPK